MTAKSIPIVNYLSLEGTPHLVANRCTSCDAMFLDRRNACASCGRDEFAPHDLATAGSLRSFTIIHRAAPGTETPFVSCVVDVDNGGVVKANLVGAGTDPANIELGMRVELTTFVVGKDDDGTEAVGFAFIPADQG